MTAHAASLADYYARRASEYERIYQKPERQSDLASVQQYFGDLFAGKRVLEIACGTGYWTQVIAGTAESVTATDLNAEVLEIAARKSFPRNNVTLQKADAFNLRLPEHDTFSALLAVFWWSHLGKTDVARFMRQLQSVLTPGALVCLMDNRLVPGSSTPISRTDDEGNTYQKRRLESGEEFEVLKNFPTRTELETALHPFATDFQWREWEYYWVITCRIGG